MDIEEQPLLLDFSTRQLSVGPMPQGLDGSDPGPIDTDRTLVTSPRLERGSLWENVFWAVIFASLATGVYLSFRTF